MCDFRVKPVGVCSSHWAKKYFLLKITHTRKQSALIFCITLTMCFVGIVVFNLVSGSYCDGGNVSEINALKTSNSTLHSVRTLRRTLRDWIKIPSPVTAVFISSCLLLDTKQMNDL
jgi:hypothetical protein